MISVARSWVTPIVIGTSVVVSISGVMMFFHLGERFVKAAHEWVGIAFAVGMLLHIYTHWRPFKQYFSQRVANAILVLCLAVTTGFVVASLGGNSKKERPPFRQIVMTVEQAPLSSVAALLDQSPLEVSQRLQQAGITVSGDNPTLMDIARSNQQSPARLLTVLFSDTRS